MIKTKEALERLYKINVEIVTNPDDLSAKYDIIHIFNFITTDVTSAFFEAASSVYSQRKSSDCH